MDGYNPTTGLPPQSGWRWFLVCNTFTPCLNYPSRANLATYVRGFIDSNITSTT